MAVLHSPAYRNATPSSASALGAQSLFVIVIRSSNRRRIGASAPELGGCSKSLNVAVSTLG